MYKNKFTLVELLIVIGIIAVLTSILLPALGKAQATAKSVKCISNLRQISQALFEYANDYKMYLPVYDGGTYDTPLYTKWQDRLLIYLMPDVVFTANTAYLNPEKTLPRGVFACPAQQEGIDYRFKHYGLNGFMSQKNIGKLTRPSGRSIVLDNNQNNTSVNEVRSNIGFRHNSRASASFADGHCTSLASQDIPLWGGDYFWGQFDN